MLLSSYLRRIAGQQGATPVAEIHLESGVEKSAIDSSTKIESGSPYQADPQLDAHTYVLGFTIAALVGFAFLREIAVYFGYGEQIEGINWITAIGACLLATGLFLYFGRRGQSKQGYFLGAWQQTGLLVLLSTIFVIYTRVLVS